MADPFDVRNAAAGAKKLATIAKIVAGLKKVQAANTSGISQPSGGNNGGGGGGGGAPVSTLAGLPQTPELKALIDKGLIREGMAPEQALAILQVQGMLTGLPIDIDKLQAQITADYAKYSGDIQGMGADWMKTMFGQNAPDPNDPNAALYAQDPMFGNYANSLAEQQGTANTNLNTDLAWFDKQQQAMTDYYNSLQMGISAGTIAGPSGGGGGGGGGGRGGRGGGGSGYGDGDYGFGDTRTQATSTETQTDTSQENWEEEYPRFYETVSNYFTDPDDRAYAIDILESYPGGPQQLAQGLVDTESEIQAQQALNADTDEANAQWQDVLTSGGFENQREQYLRDTGQMLGDIPGTPNVEWIRPALEGEANYRDPALTGNNPITDTQIQNQTIMGDALKQIYDPAVHGYGGAAPQEIADITNVLKHMQGLAQNRLNNQGSATSAAQAAAAAAARGATGETDDEGNPVVVNDRGNEVVDTTAQTEADVHEPIPPRYDFPPIDLTTQGRTPGETGTRLGSGGPNNWQISLPINPANEPGAVLAEPQPRAATREDIGSVTDTMEALRSMAMQGRQGVPGGPTPLEETVWEGQQDTPAVGQFTPMDIPKLLAQLRDQFAPVPDPNSSVPSYPGTVAGQHPTELGSVPTGGINTNVVATGNEPPQPNMQQLMQILGQTQQRQPDHEFANRQEWEAASQPNAPGPTPLEETVWEQEQLPGPEDYPAGDPASYEEFLAQNPQNGQPQGPDDISALFGSGGYGESFNFQQGPLANIFQQLQGAMPQQQEEPSDDIAQAIAEMARNQVGRGGWAAGMNPQAPTGQPTGMGMGHSRAEWENLLASGPDVTLESLRNAQDNANTAEDEGAYTPEDWQTAWEASAMDAPRAEGPREDALRALQQASRKQYLSDLGSSGFGTDAEGREFFEAQNEPGTYWRTPASPEAQTDLEGDAFVVNKIRELARPFNELWGMVNTGNTQKFQDKSVNQLQQRMTSYADVLKGLTSLPDPNQAASTDDFNIIADAATGFGTEEPTMNPMGPEDEDAVSPELDYDLESGQPEFGVNSKLLGGPMTKVLQGLRDPEIAGEAPDSTFSLGRGRQPEGFGWQTGGADMATGALKGAGQMDMINRAIAGINAAKVAKAAQSVSGGGRQKVSSVQRNQVSDVVKGLSQVKKLAQVLKGFK